MNYRLFFVLLGLITMNGNFAFSHASPPSIAMTEKIEKKIAPILAKKYKMQLCGSGGGMPDGIVDMLALSYDLNRSLTIEEVRPILVDCIDTYVNAVNAHTELTPYLTTIPFTQKNIEIRIFFQASNGEQVCDPFLCVATALRGKLIYRTEEKGQKFGFKSEIIESYEDAIKILNEKKTTAP